MAADNAAAWPRDAEIPLTDVRSVPKTGLARPPPTQQTARKGRLNFLYAAKVADHHGDVIVALGREGREDAKVNAKTHPHTAAIAAKLKTEQGDAAYRRRKSIVEAPNGWIKAVMGLRQFSMRGLDKVQAEWKLVCMALNLRRMAYL